MDNESFIQELKDFTSKPVYNWLRNEYNRRVIKKMEDLHKVCINDAEQVIRIKSGELSGFKNGFELIETCGMFR